jgi:adenosylcobinamide-phosphate synthase
MLYESVKETIAHPQKIRYLVSRDTQNLTSSEIKRASIETYAENLSDGVIAPLLYLLLFGVEGAFLYKAINTLDSMVGYRNSRYEKFGKFSAILDDIANYIPSRITALLIAILFFNRDALLKFYSFGKKHDSPNAGHPISSMALSVGLKLGGDTPYFGKMKRKPYFGDGRVEITIDDIYKALSFQLRLDILLLIILGVTIWA